MEPPQCCRDPSFSCLLLQLLDPLCHTYTLIDHYNRMSKLLSRMLTVFLAVLWWIHILPTRVCQGFVPEVRKPTLFGKPQTVSRSTAFDDNDTDSTTATAEDENTVVTITHPKTSQSVTLIGTAHLSEKSSDQVQRLIESLQPNAVMVEIDPSRLERLGFDSTNDIQVDNVKCSGDISVPMTAPRETGIFQKAFVGVFSQIARFLLTQMYKSMENDMDQKAGGEFLRALQSAQNCEACNTIILGDRDSVQTIQRVAAMAIESGDFWGVLNRLQAVNQEELSKLEDTVREDLLAQKRQEGSKDSELDEVELTTAMMEALKEDKEFRTRLFAKLEQEVPEFTQAFLKERDYIMSESIARELENRPEEVKSVVGVVGLAHVPGMEEHLKAVFADQPPPLLQDLTTSTVFQ